MDTFGMFLLLVVVGSSIWVGLDARQLGIRKGTTTTGVLDAGPFGWFCCSLLLWIIAFPLYLANRSRLSMAAQKAAEAYTPAGPKRSAQTSSTPQTDLDLQREADARAAFLAELAAKRRESSLPQSTPVQSSPPSDTPPSSTVQLLQEILDVQRQTAADIRQIRNAIAAAILSAAVLAIIIALSNN